MPSTTSNSVSRLFASSTVITPSFPTFCIASEIIPPTSASPLEAIVPTCLTSLSDLTGFEFLWSSLTIASAAVSIPLLRSIGFKPAATAFIPSVANAWHKTVEVVVPSPARSLVLLATSLIIWAPIFSNLSANSISLATVTPSLVVLGEPKDLSITTLRPFGPKVTLTASAKILIPLSILALASVPNWINFADIL